MAFLGEALDADRDIKRGLAMPPSRGRGVIICAKTERCAYRGSIKTRAEAVQLAGERLALASHVFLIPAFRIDADDCS